MYGTDMTADRRFELRIASDLVDRMDQARGRTSRAAFIKAALERALGDGEGVGKDVDRASGASSVGSTFGTGATIRTPEPARLPDYTPKAEHLAPVRASLGNTKPHEGTCRCPECKAWLTEKGWT